MDQNEDILKKWWLSLVQHSAKVSQFRVGQNSTAFGNPFIRLLTKCETPTSWITTLSNVQSSKQSNSLDQEPRSSKTFDYCSYAVRHTGQALPLLVGCRTLQESISQSYGVPGSTVASMGQPNHPRMIMAKTKHHRWLRVVDP